MARLEGLHCIGVLYADVLQGVKAGDIIMEFGSVTEQTFQGLQDIGTVVQHSRGVSQQGPIVRT